MSAEILQLVSDTLDFLGRDLRIQVAPPVPKAAPPKPAPPPPVYRNNLKNREFGEEAAEILESGASDIVREQGASEDPKFQPQPTWPKTDSLSCFGIKPKEPAPVITTAPPKTLLDKIKKHLPHLQLVEQFPAMRRVAIVVANQEDLPFLRNLKNAIEKHHCPVKMLTEDASDWEQFALVISQRQVNAKRKILLESIAAYQNNTEQKKLLWSTICNMLSQKSS